MKQTARIGPTPESGPQQSLSPRLAFLLATASGLIVANMYYAQPLVGLIGASLGLSPAATGLVVTLTQLGYGVGLLLVVPLGDLFENRRLILLLGACCVLSLIAAALDRFRAAAGGADRLRNRVPDPSEGRVRTVPQLHGHDH